MFLSYFEIFCHSFMILYLYRPFAYARSRLRQHRNDDIFHLLSKLMEKFCYVGVFRI